MNKTEKILKDEIIQLKQKHLMELQAYEIRIRNSDKVLETKLKTIQDISDKIQEFSKFLFQQDLNLSKKNMLDNIKSISVILLQEKDSYDIMASSKKQGQTGLNDIKNRQEIQNLQLEIDDQQYLIEQSKEKIKHQENQIVDQEKIIHKIQVVLKEHEQFIQQKDEKLNQLDSTLKKKDDELANMMNQYKRKDNELDNMMKQSVRIIKQNEEEINKIINKKKEEINEIHNQKEMVLLQKQQEINEINKLKEKVLLQKEQEISEIQKQKEQIAIQKENEIKFLKTKKTLQNFQKSVKIVEARNRADKSLNDMRNAFTDEVHQKEDEINDLKKKTEYEMKKIKHEFIDEVHHKEEEINQINRLKEQQINQKEEEIKKLKTLTKFREAAHIGLLQQANLKQKQIEINRLKEDLLNQKDDEIKKVKLQDLQYQSDALNRLRESLQLQNQKQYLELTNQIQFQQIFFDELVEKQRKDQEQLSQNYTIMLSKMQKQSQKMNEQQKNIEKLQLKHQQDDLIIQQQELALMDPHSSFKLFRTWSSFIKLPTKEHYFEDQLLSQRRNNQSLNNRSADRFKNDSNLNTARNLTFRGGEGGNTARNLTPSRYDTVKKDRKQDPQFDKQIQIEQVIIKFRKWAFNISYQIKIQINAFKKKEVFIFYLILKKQGAKISPQYLINMLEQIYKHTHFIDNTIQQITREKSPHKTEQYDIQEKQYFEEIDNINPNNQKKDEKKFDYKDAQKIKNRICSSIVLKEFKQISKK